MYNIITNHNPEPNNMDTTNFIKSLNSLSDQELYRVKDNLVEQLNIVEALLMSRWKSEEHSAIALSLIHI